MKLKNTILIVVSLVFSMLVSNIYATTYELGDVNQDGEITLADSALIRRYVVGWNITLTDEQLKLADVTGDGVVDKRDALLIKQKAADWNVDFPTKVAEYGDINQDGTIDSNDAVLLKQYLAGQKTLTDMQKELADVLSSGTVDSFDYELLSRYLAGENIKLPLYVERLGDVNQDGEVTLEDSALITRYVTGWDITLTDEQLLWADVTFDGVVDKRDAFLIKQNLADESVTFPTKIAEYGDINQDGTIDSKDTVLLKQYLAGQKTLTDTQKELADVLSDGTVDSFDYELLSRYLSGKNIKLPLYVEHLGDVNQDGEVSLMDSALIDRYVDGWNITLTDEQLLWADVTCDGVVDKRDSILIKQKLVGNVDFPTKVAEYGDINQDGTIDSNDTVLLNQYLAGQRTFNDMQKELADVAKNDVIDNEDLEVLLRYLAGENITLPIKAFEYGDVNQDGTINALDLEIVKKYIDKIDTDLSTNQKLAADVTNDGIIDMRDYGMLHAKILKVYTGKFPVAVAEYGDVNEDGTINVLDLEIVKKYIAEIDTDLSITQQVVADVTGDEIIDIRDYRVLQAKILKVYTGDLPLSVAEIGDLNADGKIDIKDYKLLKKYLENKSTLTLEQEITYDINCDEVIDEEDLKALSEQLKLVESITLNKTSLTFSDKSTQTLSVASTLPSDANNKAVTWSSSNTSIATVSSTGVVTPVANGSCNIIATAADGSDVTAKCSVVVSFKVSSLKLNYSSLTFGAFVKSQLKATVEPSYAEVKTIRWTSSDERVATVNSAGLITLVGNGTCNIIATTTDGSNISASCSVTVAFRATSIILSQSRLTFTDQNEKTLTATVYPEYANNRNVQWTSSDEKIATVDSKGTVSPVSNGTCTITAKTVDGSNISKTCNVEVNIAEYISLTVDKTSINYTDRKSQKITAKVESSTKKDVIYSSSNPQVATVSNDGVVTPVSTGNCVITVKVANATSVKKLVQVNVKLPYIVGNFDENDKLDVTDAYLLLDKIVNNKSVEKDVEEIIDMNEDGIVDVTDAYLLLKILAEML